MTVAAGLIADGADAPGVWLASDSMAARGETVEYDMSKVIRCADGRIGFVSSGYALGLRLMAEVVESILAEHPLLVMTELAHQMRAKYEEVGWTPAQQAGAPASWDQHYILTDGLTLWSIGCDLDARRKDHYTAIGGGAEVALGAMHALTRGGLRDPGGDVTPERIIRHAVEAAINHSAYAGGGVKTSFVVRPEFPLVIA